MGVHSDNSMTKSEDEIINEYIGHVHYREEYTPRNEKDTDYAYENGYLAALLWSIRKEDIE